MAGFVTRVVLFVLTPTFYGADNTLLYVSNRVVQPGFDGWPTLISPLVALAVFMAVVFTQRGRPVAGATIEGREPVAAA